MSKELIAIGKALNEISWCWLNDNHPRLAEAIETEVGRGVTAEQVRRYIMQQTHRLELALRCEQAASWLIEGQDA